jgi:hypothetical protein
VGIKPKIKHDFLELLSNEAPTTAGRQAGFLVFEIKIFKMILIEIIMT